MVLNLNDISKEDELKLSCGFIASAQCFFNILFNP